MSKANHKQLFEQLQLQLSVANKTAKQLSKALGFDESVTPKKKSQIDVVLAKNRERYIRNADRRGRKAEQNNS